MTKDKLEYRQYVAFINREIELKDLRLKRGTVEIFPRFFFFSFCFDLKKGFKEILVYIGKV